MPRLVRIMRSKKMPFALTEFAFRTNRGRIYVVKGTGTLTNKPKLALIEFALFGDRTNRGIAVFRQNSKAKLG